MNSVHPSAVVWPNVTLGDGARVEPHVVLGNVTGEPLEIGHDAVIRSGTRIYGGVRIGDGLRTGHNALIRGDVQAGDGFHIGSYSSVEGTVWIGDGVILQGRVEVADSFLHDRCRIWVGTYVCDNVWPPDGQKDPPVIGPDSRVFAGVIVMPGTHVGDGAVVAAGAVASGDIPAGHLYTRGGRLEALREPLVAAGMPSRISLVIEGDSEQLERAFGRALK